jgi:uncharacterized protein (TIGR03663 family)
MSEKAISSTEIKPQHDLFWLLNCFLIAAVAAFLRFYWLGLKPFHHDEGVNGHFLMRLFREGVYRYDPENYHGPTLYYITLAFTKIFGLETVPVRWSVAVWGVLTVILAFFLRRYIGKIGSLFAALFLALSPGMVFISRYFIHEIFFVFLSLAAAVAVVRFIEREKAGPFAIGWTALLLIVCFVPSTLRLAGMAADEGTTTYLLAQVFLLLIMALLVFLVLRMLLAWQDGRPIYLLLASASIAFLFATKETAFITLGTMLIAVFCIWIWLRLGETARFRNVRSRLLAVLFPPLLAAAYFYETLLAGIAWLRNDFFSGNVLPAGVAYLVVSLLAASVAAWIYYAVREVRSGSDISGEGEEITDELTFVRFRSAMGNGIDLLLIALACAVMLLYVGIIFFSSFFSYPDGVQKAFEAYAIWTKTGTKDHTQSGTWAYLKWAMEIEAPLIILSSLGMLIAFLNARHRFAMFAGLWSLGLFAAYSIIPYKTPWLMLSFLLPMCLAAGYAVNELASSTGLAGRLAAGVLGIVSCIILGYQTYNLNFVEYDNERMPYVYAHTNREFIAMMEEIERYTELSGKGKEAKIQVVSPDYWPMVWYTRDYQNAIYHGRIAASDAAEVIVAKKGAQDAEVMRNYSAQYAFVGSYRLRPGVDLILLVRKDLARDRAEEPFRIRD